MERGILFSKSERRNIECSKSYACPNLGYNPAFDEGEKSTSVTSREATYYDEILERTISTEFF